jgi:hypothetical protein
MSDEQRPTLEQVKAMIERLDRADRAMLRPWMLARYDAQGQRQYGYVGRRGDAD